MSTDDSTATTTDPPPSTDKDAAAASASAASDIANNKFGQDLDATPAVGNKALPVITAAEIGRIIDLGLGRGIDATDPSPWQHKSSFQVRRVTIDNVIGTEEGGSLQAYEQEISSVITQQTNLKASVAIPQAPVNLGAEGEQARSVTTTRKAIGKRVVNRTISFASQFDDLSQSSSKSERTSEAQAETIVPRVLYPEESETKEEEREKKNIFTFEERLAKWIIERVLHRCQLSHKIKDTTMPPEVGLIKGVNPLEDLSNYINAVDRDTAKQIVTDCADFVQHFRITHYVTSVSLGAAQYRILSEEEYYNKISASAKLGIDKIGNFVLSESFSKKSTRKNLNLREIGKIVDEKVARGTYDEAVVEIGILPIHQLVQLRFLHLALRKALLDYIDVQGDKTAGPFLMMAGENIYMKVNPGNGNSLEGTTQVREASEFFIMPTDDAERPYEFLIGWDGDDDRQLKRLDSTRIAESRRNRGLKKFRFLDGSVNFLGRNSGPLRMKYEVPEDHARFSLQSRLLRKRDGPVNLQNWVLGRDLYLIHCARRHRAIDGYLAMKAVNRRGGDGRTYTSVCVSTPQHHNETTTFMLFSLVSPAARGGGLSSSQLMSPEYQLDDEFDDYIAREEFKDVPLLGKGGKGAGIEMLEIPTAKK